MVICMAIKAKNLFWKTLLTIIVVMTMGFFLFSVCSKIKDKEKIYKGSVFEKNNNIYIYYYGEKYLEPVGDIEKLKEFSTLSPDHNKIAFRYQNFENQVNDKIEIYDIENKEYKSLTIDNKENFNIIDLKWVGSDNLMITLHLNPNESKYLVYNVKDENLINVAEGLVLGTMNEGETIIYSKHNEDSTNKIYCEDEIIFDSIGEGEEFYIGNLSEDKKNIAFITSKYEIEKSTFQDFLYICKFRDNKIEDVKKIEKPYEILGDILFDEKDQVYINSEDGTYKLKGDNFEKATYPPSEDMPSEEILMSFYNTLKSVFDGEALTDDNILEELNIEWIQWF